MSRKRNGWSPYVDMNKNSQENTFYIILYLDTIYNLVKRIF